MPRKHVCATCGHVVHLDHDQPVRIYHEADGGHRYTISVNVNQSWGGKRA